MAEQRSNEIKAASQIVLDEMLAELALTVSITAHREIKRSRVPCGVCGTKCRSAASFHPTSTGSSLAAPKAGPSRAPSPLPNSSSSQDGGGGAQRAGGYAVGPEKGTGGSTGIGSGSGRPEGAYVFFDCLVCGRATASSRYAQHLSSCLGFSGSTRRGTARSAAASAKARMGQERSASPYVGAGAGATPSEAGDSDDGSVGGGGRKGKKVLNANGKRGLSPKKPPAGSLKKSRVNGVASVSVSGTATPTSRPNAPSKLSRPPTTAADRDRNRNRTAGSSEPPSDASSPERSLSSGAPLAVAGAGAGAGAGKAGYGMPARKTLPGLGGAGRNGTPRAPVHPKPASTDGSEDLFEI